MDTIDQGTLELLVGAIADDGAAWALLALVFVFGSYMSWQQQRNNDRAAERAARSDAEREESFTRRMANVVERYDRTLREVTDLLGRNAELLREATWVIRKATAALERSNEFIIQLEALLPARRRMPKSRSSDEIPLTGREKEFQDYKEETNGD